MGTYESGDGHGKEDAQRLAPTYFLGIGLWLVWTWSVTNPALFLKLDPTGWPHLLWARAEILLRVSALAVLVAGVAANRALESPRLYRAVIRGGAIASVIGSLGLELILQSGSPNLDALAYAHATAAGAGAAVLFLGWSVAYAGLPQRLLVQTSALALAFATVLGCAVAPLGPQLPLACPTVLPLLSFALLRSTGMRPCANVPLGRIRRGFPWQLVAMLGCVSFACGFNTAGASPSDSGGIALWLPGLFYTVAGCLMLPVLATASQQGGPSAVLSFGLAKAVSELMRVLGTCSRIILLAHPFGPPALLGTLPIVLSTCFTGLIIFRLADTGDERAGVPETPGATAPLQFTATAAPYRPQPNLTRRESEVVEALVDGLTYQQISEELTVTMSTVKTHVHHVYRKLGVTNRNDAVSVVISERRAWDQAEKAAPDPLRQTDQDADSRQPRRDTSKP